MQKIFFALSLLFSLSRNAQAQCPNASFSLPDTVCSGTMLPLINTSTGNGLTYQWDFCPREIHGLTSYRYFRYNNYVLNTMTDMDLLKVGNGYYLITMDSISNNFVVGNIGNHLSNQTFDAIINSGFTKLNCFDFIVEGDTNVYGLAAYAPTSTLYLMAFPGGIQVAPVLTPLPTFSTVANPADIKIVHADNIYYAFVASKGNGNVTCLTFGNSLINSPTELYSLNIPGSIKLSDIDIVTTCSPPVGFVSDSKNGDLTKLSFTNGFSNAPTLSVYSGTGSIGNNSVVITQEFESYFVCYTDTANKQLKWLQFDDNNFANTPTVYTSPAFYFGPNQAELLTDSSITRFIVNDAPTLNFVEMLYFDSCYTKYSEDQNPPFSYLNTGWNKLSLTVSDSNGYQSIAYDSVFVITGPKSQFSFSGNTCFNPNDSITFNDQSTSPSGAITDWLWDFGDGATSTQQNPQHAFTSPGTYQVKLTITAGCEKDTIIPITIHALPIVNFTYSLSCANSATTLTDQSFSAAGLQSWSWNFGDGSSNNQLQNPDHIFQSGGNYNVQLTVTDSSGCIDSIVNIVQVKATPSTAFMALQTCLGDTVQLSNTSTISDSTALTYFWDFGSGITSTQTDTVIYFTSAGSYPATLIAYSSQGCSDTLNQNIVVSTPPSVNFGFPSSNCQYNAITFSDSTVGFNLSSWQWDFGDGDTSSLQSPTHVYNLSGNYTVQLTVSSGNDCAASYSQTINILEGPSAAFLTGNGCQGVSTNFTDQSTVSSGSSIVAWQWHYGDGDSSQIQNPSHIYAAAGSYNVLLRVTSDNGCQDTTSQPVQVFENPIAGFYVQPLRCANTEIYFLDTSSIGNGNISQWQWQFSNGTTSNLPNPFAIFNNAGSASATLTVITSDGCSNSNSFNFTVRPQPDFTIAHNGVCKGKQTSFNYFPNGNISAYAWTWYFGDNTYAFTPNATHLYATSGTYPFSMAVTDSFGCQKTIFDTLTIYPTPDAAFITNGICQNAPVDFINQTDSTNTQINGWQWSFGDGNSSSQHSSQHIYNGTGNYTVSLIAYAAGGCNDTVFSVVNIKPVPEIAFSMLPPTGAPGNNVQVFNNTTGATSYSWDFGDGSPLNLNENPTHVYNDTGSYVITLTASSIFNCMAQLQKPYDVIVPYVDLWLKSLSYTINNNYLSLSALLSNIGNTTINNFDLLIQPEGKGSFIENGNETIPFATEKNYALHTSISINPSDLPEFICVRIKNVNNGNDLNPDNNEKCISLMPENGSMSVSPNPIEDVLSIHLNLPASSEITLVLYDATGKKLTTLYQGTTDAGFKNFSFKLPYLSKGVYIIGATSESLNKILKFIRQ